MCAYIIGNPFGEFRGKLGGNIFSKNGHGAYIRNYVLPINPNTVAQNNARSSFGSVVNQYSTLSADLRANWKEYARSNFVPRSHSHSMRYSGYQSFISLNMALKRAIAFTRDYDLEFNGVANPYSTSYIGWVSEVDEPPEKSKLLNFVDKNDRAHNLSLLDCSLFLPDVVSFTLRLGAGGGSYQYHRSIDENLNYTGFVVYMSNPIPGANYFVRNPLYNCLGFFRPWFLDNAPADEASFREITYTSTDNINTADYKSWPYNGDWVRLTVYCIDPYGQMRKVGSKDIECQF
jgi:hypothetical protein